MAPLCGLGWSLASMTLNQTRPLTHPELPQFCPEYLTEHRHPEFPHLWTCQPCQ